ncbi:hypothetical protein RJ55_06922 [Drechmeria coniospora]|nr:hypothetical protein RJ55_06922 [Drechmeria coniospora]
MDGLEEFEKSLAAEKAERERAERDGDERRKHHKHRHGHRHDDSRSHHHHHRHEHRHEHKGRDEERNRKHRVDEDSGHRHKRSRHSRDDAEGNRHQQSGRSRTDYDARSKPEENAGRDDRSEAPQHLERDAWMTAPSALEVEHVHRPARDTTPPPKEAPKRMIHSRELNSGHLQALNDGQSLPDAVLDADADAVPAERSVDYLFGDEGSSWRMTKLKAVYTAAEESGRSVDAVALERFGSLQDFDDAREEKNELERRKLYGHGYREREKPTGDLYRERRRTKEPTPEPEQGTVLPAARAPMDPTALNRLRAQMMKAKLRKAPNAAQLEQEYNEAAAAAAAHPTPQAVVLGVMDNRQLAGTRAEVKAVTTQRGRDRGAVEENADMSIDDMVREERRTKGQAGGEGMRLAERIAKDAKYDDNLEYMDENAEKLARRVHKSEANLKNMAVNEFQRLNRVLDSCPLCHHEDTGRPPLAPVVSLGTRVFLTLATEPELGEGGAVIVPLAHRRNLLECDDDEWEEVRNFMKCLTRMYHEQGRDVLFYENAAAPRRHLHAAMVAVPIPYEEGVTAPAFFREAFLSSDEEWSQHKKVIDTAARARDGLGRMAFRRSIAKEMPYFHVWFSLDGGLGHVVENADRWPRGDLFAREVVASIVGAEPHLAKKQGRWSRADPRLEPWKKSWRKFDWTRALTSE